MKETTVARRTGAAGFSLIELIVALAVIAISLFGILSLILHTHKTKEAQRELDIAKQAAAAKLEEIKAQSVSTDTIGETVGPYVRALYGSTATPASYAAAFTLTSKFTVTGLSMTGAWTTTATPATTSRLGKGTVYIDGANPSLLDITITIEWGRLENAGLATERGTSHYSMRSLYTK